MKKIEENKKIYTGIFLLLTLLGIQFNMKDLLNKDFLYSYSSELNQVFNALLVVVTFILYSKVTIHVKEKLSISTLAFLLGSVVAPLGAFIKYKGTIFVVSSNNLFISIISVLIKCTSNSFLIYMLLVILFYYLNEYGVNVHSNNKSSIKLWAVYVAGMLIVWIPMMVILYPGVLGWDGADQINQFFGAKSGELQFYLTNHHPYFTTIILGNLWRVGSLLGKANYTVFFVAIVLCVVFIGCLNYLIVVIRKYYGQNASNILYIFFCLFPIFPFWALTLDKTIIFLIAFTLFLTSLLIILNKRENLSKQDILLLFVSAILVGLSRNDGFAYIIATTIGGIFLKTKRKVIITVLLSSFLVVIIFNKLLLPTLRVIPSEPMESLGVPLQQIARTYKYNPHSITKEQDKKMNEYLNSKMLAQAYDPGYYDYVKNLVYYPSWKLSGKTYKQREKYLSNVKIKKDKDELYKLWYQIGKNNKKIYVDSFIVSNFGYLYPIGDTNLIWIGPFGGPGTISAYEYTTYTKGYKPFNNKIQEDGYHFITKIPKLPYINLILSCYFWTWLFFIFATYLLSQYQKQFLLLLLPLLVTLIVALVGPVNSGLRYVFPLTIGVPVLIIISVYKQK